METTITYKSIGTIRTSFEIIEGMPIQPYGAPISLATIELDPELLPGLKDIEGFSLLILIYHLVVIKIRGSIAANDSNPRIVINHISLTF
jgi:tRNA (Thr-GGU) A37 N-methylase